MFGVWGGLGSARHLLPVLVAEGNVVATKPGRPSLYVHGARPEKQFNAYGSYHDNSEDHAAGDDDVNDANA